MWWILALSAAAAPPVHHAVIVEFLGTSGMFGSHDELGIGSFHARGGPCDGGPGVTMAVRAGVGPAWGPSSSGLKIEPALELIPLQVGMAL